MKQTDNSFWHSRTK